MDLSIRVTNVKRVYLSIPTRVRMSLNSTRHHMAVFNLSGGSANSAFIGLSRSVKELSFWTRLMLCLGRPFKRS